MNFADNWSRVFVVITFMTFEERQTHVRNEVGATDS